MKRPHPSTVALALLTVACWGVILLAPDALFWDDWVTEGGDIESLYNDLGIPWIGHVAAAISVVGPVAFKIIGVICAVVVALAARGIAARGLGLSPTQTWFAAALVVLLPFNIARVSVAVLSTYSISLAVFFLAWWLLVKAGPRRHARAAVASALFFASFTTASLLAFIAIPVAHLALLEIDRSRVLGKQLLGFVGRSWYLLATPVLFWSVRTAFFHPRGVYANYNNFVEWTWPLSQANVGAFLMVSAGAGGIVLLGVRAIMHQHQRVVDLTTAMIAGVGTIALAPVVWFLRGATSADAIIVIAIVAAAGIVIVVTALAATRSPRLPQRIGQSAFLASAGLVAFAIGALPYLLVGKIPEFVDWETRHQLLLPVGTALLAVAAVVAAGGPSAFRVVAIRVASAVTVGVSAAAVVVAGLMFVADWHKQVQIIDALRQMDDVRAASTVIVADDVDYLNFDSRQYRFYEPIGWLHAAYGDRTRFAIVDADIEAFVSGTFDSLIIEGVRYGFPDWDSDGGQIGVRIELDPQASWWDLLVGNPVIRVTSMTATLDTSREHPQ
ncbi:MAG: hypothetical protein JW722_06810 [Demequinaceae bacterium]|nr:hypothetical protein [Demequinaceae bacterium]